MPTTYAHYRLGEEVREGLDPQAQAAIAAYPDLFHFGVHGPDLLFYYKPLSQNAVNQVGHRMHDVAAIEFFSAAVGVVRNHPASAAHLAYIYGFICHFAMDETCHGYVEEYKDRHKVSHSRIEAELDAALLRKDGFVPVKRKLTGHLHPSIESAKVIADFFQTVSAEDILAAEEGMVKYLDLLVQPNPIKRLGLQTAMRIAGCYHSLGELILCYKPDPKCAESTHRLLELYDGSVRLAKLLIHEFPAAVDDLAPLNKIYRYDFMSVLRT